MAFCINCGSQIPDGAKFCVACGTPVVTAPAPEPVAEPIAEPAVQPAPAPIVEPMPTPVAEPAVQPAPAPVAEPAVQPTPAPQQTYIPPVQQQPEPQKKAAVESPKSSKRSAEGGSKFGSIMMWIVGGLIALIIVLSVIFKIVDIAGGGSGSKKSGGSGTALTELIDDTATTYYGGSTSAQVKNDKPVKPDNEDNKENDTKNEDVSAEEIPDQDNGGQVLAKDIKEADTSSVKGEIFDAGNITVLVPDGWLGVRVIDVWSDDNADDPDKAKVAKGAKDEYDVSKCNYVEIEYEAEGEMLFSSSTYDNGHEIESVNLCGREWYGMEGELTTGEFYTMDLATVVGDGFIHVRVWLDNRGEVITMNDPDVQAIIESITIK